MLISDPVGDMLTRLRNASRARHDKVVIPLSRLKLEVLKVLKDEGYVGDFTVHETKPQGQVTVELKYGPDRQPVFVGIKRVSKPGLRRYVKSTEIPQVLGGMGVAILSTSRGIMSDAEARRQKVGGELLCTVY
jgi:small subunit ribosomal protein S8